MNRVDNVALIIPAYNAQPTIQRVVRDVFACWPSVEKSGFVIVVDDGSKDDTAMQARDAGAQVVSHTANRGKGAALRTGFLIAKNQGFSMAVTLDADAQHPASQALKLAQLDADEQALVLGIRDLKTAGAPKANQTSNRISNFFLSRFASMPLQDTQCGLRRYPIAKTLELQGKSDGFAYEAEIVLLAKFAKVPIVQVPIDVRYEPTRTSHFNAVKDPARIIGRVLWTLARK